VNAAGSGSSNVTITAPTTIDRTLRQTLPMNLEGSASIINGSATLMAFLGGTGAVFDRVRAYDGTSLLGSDLTASMLLTVQGWYREA
jgi:hypothetical protein